MKICWNKYVEENREAFVAMVTEPIRPKLDAIYPISTAEERQEVKRMLAEELSKPLPAKLESIFDYTC